MKKSNNSMKTMIFVIGCLILGIMGCIIYSKQKVQSNIWQDYSVTNDSETGYSVLYKVLKKLDLNVKKEYTPLNQVNTDACQIIAGDQKDCLKDGFKWALDGGTFVYISNEKIGDLLSEEIEMLDGQNYTIEPSQITDQIRIMKLGKGIFIRVTDEDGLTNLSMSEDTELAYGLYDALCQYAPGRKIIFNEYYMYTDDESAPSLWTVAPLYVKCLIIQAAIILVCYFIYKGKRFGKVRILAGEQERLKNEYIYAVANIYRRANAWEVVVDSYYHKLENKLKDLTKSEADFLEIWQTEKLPEIEKVKALVSYMTGSTKGKNKNEVMYYIKEMEHLMKFIDKRREQYWKF